jgi:tetratricopeptide (TPR) repeat protein
MARTTVFRYKGKEVDPQEVGRRLGVRAVLTGRVSHREARLNIQMELVDVLDGSQVWGEQYKRSSSDIFEVQEEITQEITDKLRLRLSGEDQGRLTKRYTENTVAYEFYLKGRYHWNKRTVEGFEKGIECFQQAIGLDAAYALAYAGLSDCYALLGDVGLTAIPSSDAFSRAKATAVQAIKIDETLADAHASLAHVHMHEFAWRDAEREFKRAIELNANNAKAHQWYSFYLLFNGRNDEAIREIERALELDPLSLPTNSDLGQILYYTRHYDQAIEQYHKTLELESTYYRTHLYLGWVYEQKSMYEEALSEFQQARQLVEALASIGRVYGLSGKTAKARGVLTELEDLSARRYISPYQRALLYLSLGEKDKTFEWLNRAFENRAEWIIYLMVDPRLDALHSDPRFNDLSQRLGFNPLASPSADSSSTSELRQDRSEHEGAR